MFPIKDNIPTDSFPIVTVVADRDQRRGYSCSGSTRPASTAVDDTKVVEYGAIPYELTHPGTTCALASGLVACEGQPGVVGTAPDQPVTILTVFTSMFMHGGVLHLVGNMLFLWIFGNNVEDSMGPVRFVAFYLLGGIAALLGAGRSSIPTPTVPTIGASGRDRRACSAATCCSIRGRAC